MKPLVFHIRASNFFGGPERQILGHIKSSHQFRHLVVTFQGGDVENAFQQECLRQGVPVAVIRTRHSYQWSAVQQLRELVAENQPSILCCHGYRPLALVLLAKKKAPVSIIAFSRGHTSENLKVRLFEYAERKLYALADAIVAVSQGYAQTLKIHGVEPNKIEVIANAIQPEKFTDHIARKEQTRQELGFTAEDTLIATAGRLSPEKAQGDLIAAFSQLCHRHHRAHLLICGDGPLRQTLAVKAAELGSRNVHFLGHRTDFDRLMPVFDAFVLPSLTEGLPNVLLEAAACHVPIVATHVGGVPEVVTDGASGWLVEPGDILGLARAIEQCITDRNKARQFASLAFRHIEATFGVQQQSRKLEDLYERMMVGSQPPCVLTDSTG